MGIEETTTSTEPGIPEIGRDVSIEGSIGQEDQPVEAEARTTQGSEEQEKPKHAGGRPTIMTEETIQKLEEIFALGGTDREACFFANISQATLYNYQNDNPEFVERKEALKDQPVLKARRSVVGALEDPEIAIKYLERKKKDEFSLRQETTGADGGAIKHQVDVTKLTTDELAELTK